MSIKKLRLKTTLKILSLNYLKTLVVRLMFLVALSCLSSCQSFPTIEDQQQCSAFISLEVDSAGRRIVNEVESVCLCRQYKWSKGYVGPVGDLIEKDIEQCNKVIGHLPDSYLEVQDFYERVRIWLNDRQKFNNLRSPSR